MSTPSASPSATTKAKELFERHVKPFLTPYYLTIAGVLGAITAGFGALVVVLILIVTNFNVLGWME